jgi:hypothetical protein
MRIDKFKKYVTNFTEELKADIIIAAMRSEKLGMVEEGVLRDKIEDIWLALEDAEYAIDEAYDSITEVYDLLDEADDEATYEVEEAKYRKRRKRRKQEDEDETEEDTGTDYYLSPEDEIRIRNPFRYK